MAVQALLHSIYRLTFLIFLGGPYNGTYHRELRPWVTTMGCQRASYVCVGIWCVHGWALALRVPELSVYMDIAVSARDRWWLFSSMLMLKLRARKTQS